MVKFYKAWNGEGDFGKWSVDQVDDLVLCLCLCLFSDYLLHKIGWSCHLSLSLSFLIWPFTWTMVTLSFVFVFVFSEMTFHTNLGDIVICLCLCWVDLSLNVRWSCPLWSFDPTSSSVICRRQMAFGAGALPILPQRIVQLDKHCIE